MTYDQFKDSLDKSKFKHFYIYEDIKHESGDFKWLRFTGRIEEGSYLEVFGCDLDQIYKRIPNYFKSGF